jgi:hypothetical protein
VNERLALRVLGSIMSWDTERATREFRWLSLMSRMKYDSYRDYVAGARFIESLADWLQQFERKERECAYEFVRHHLAYFGPGEMQHLVELFYPETVEPHLISAVAQRLRIPRHLVWATEPGRQLYAKLLRQTLFLGLSDGARMDTFRRANVGIVSNEQVVGLPQINQSKWNDLLGELREALRDTGATFECAYLLDDFAGSGKTLLRKHSTSGEWEGRLARFWDDSRSIVNTHFSPEWSLRVHHYLSTARAQADIPASHDAARADRGVSSWFGQITFTYGMVLARDFPIVGRREFDAFLRLVDRYYDPNIETKSMRVGGDNAKLGFGSGALPLILEHNTPNNSVSLLWADTAGGPGVHGMRPLFRRRQRHS